MIFTTVEVLPVPGPPDMTQKRLATAATAATFCQSVPSPPLSGKSLPSPAARSVSSMLPEENDAFSRMTLASSCSYFQ